jgi:hypothetical protein
MPEQNFSEVATTWSPIMKQTINFHDFRDAFLKCGRINNFSRDGLNVLFDYLTQLEEDTGQELEMDVIALCCDYNESSAQTIIQEYNLEPDTDVEEYLLDQGAYCGATDGTFIYSNF